MTDPALMPILDTLRDILDKLDAPADPVVQDVIDRANRLLGIVYGSLDKLQQRATTKDLLVQLRSGGAEIDPRQIRALTSSDVVDLAYSTTPAIYNMTMTNANTEYSQALPANTRKFTIHTRDETAFRLAFVTGKVATPTAPYLTIPANKVYYEDFVNLTSKTLYFASGSAGKIIEIVAWT